MCSDRLRIFTNQDFDYAEYWFAVLLCSEDKIMQSVIEVLVRFGMRNPFKEHVAVVAENFLGMMQYTFEEGETYARERFFATHGAAYPESVRQAFKAATINLSSWTRLFTSTDTLRQLTTPSPIHSCSIRTAYTLTCLFTLLH